MKSILIELQCRTCMYHTYRKSETLVISDFETQVKEQLLQDTYFTMLCPRCKTLVEYLHPLIYVDTQHKFILLIKPKKEVQESDHKIYEDDLESKKRLLCNTHSISEKIKIFEDDLDDRTIEVLKYKLQQHVERKRKEKARICYQDKDDATNTIWFQVGEHKNKEMMAISMDEYHKVHSIMPTSKNQRYEEIDQSWVLHHFFK